MKYDIFIKNFNFKYTNKYVLNNINIQIKKGNCVGLLGSNGSGKTTLINCILGELKGEGNIEVLGKKPDIYSNKFKENIGVVLDNDILLDYLTLNEYLLYIGRIYNIKENDLKEKIDYWIKFFKMDDDRNRVLKFFSHGMRKKTQIISSLINNPKLIIIDEPTNGLDVEMIYLLKNIIKDLKNKEITILISTHIISFLEDVCDEVLIIDRGILKRKVNLMDLNENLEEIFIKEVIKDGHK